MRKSFVKMVVLFLMLGMALLPASNLFAQEAVEEVSGEVVSVNVDDSTLVVNYATEEGAAAEEAVFNVTAETQIMRNEQAASLSELQGGDEVFLEFAKDANGNMVVKSIAVQ